ncbi:uncharacterized protein LOC111066333 [Drosophila obscura]|uniref:uncharacterized protein LOC111066333 n=1 Tax=Drosophila obscura TaxID=7282 RepID=UPI001BB19476|nr:uncharacterized protein LOC111066333 [Drosophila obscura]
MRYISLAFLLLLVCLALISHYGTDASTCEQSGKRMRDLLDWDEDEGCSRSSYPKVMSETVAALTDNVDKSDNADESNVPQEGFFSKLRRAFLFVYKIIMWYVNLTRE